MVADCLRYAMDTGQQGIWGATTWLLTDITYGVDANSATA